MLQLLGGPIGEWIMALLCLAQFVGWSGGRKRVGQNSVTEQWAWRLCMGCEGGKSVIVVVAEAHDLSA